MNQKALVPVVALVVLLGAACADGDDDDTARVESIVEDSDDDSTSDRSETTEATETTDGEASNGEERDRGAEPLGTTRGQRPATPLDSTLVPLRIDVTHLERNDELVELAMTLTNETQEADLAFEPYSQFGSDESASATYDIGGVGLIDQGEQKLYLPVYDSEGTCLCTDVADLELEPGQSVELHATFGGLPEDIGPLDLRVPGFEPLAGLEVEE